jgi:hypothetical protein
MKSFPQKELRTSGGSGCPATTLVHSKYESMVTNFSSWADMILKHMVGHPRKSLHESLLKQYQHDFVPNGKHKHALVMGANMAKLQSSTIQTLRSHVRLQTLVRDLGYNWFGHDQD